MLRPIRTVIVDEIHALADDKRGSHLSLSLERLQALTRAPLQRIGLSATQHPIEEIARFLVGTPQRRARRHARLRHRRRQPAARSSTSPSRSPRASSAAVAPTEQWGETYDRLAELIREHRTTLVFVNTRRLVERVAHALQERLGEDQVAAHHGSLSRRAAARRPSRS